MNKNQESRIARPPVVVVTGHIDHGKSTLLDYIRKSNSVDKEEGGITQHISAYEAECEVEGKLRKITFLDTPGHEAFISMRARGVQAADIAILVVSAEDGVKTQTIESIKSIKEDGLPFIVAVTKIDKANSNVDKVKQSLAENEVLVEGWGGSIPIVPLSSKSGEGVPLLLEVICLQADLEELKGDSNIGAEGFIIESNLSPKEGIRAVLIIKDGSMTKGDYVATTGAFAGVRSIENFAGKLTTEATFSSPVRIVGWSSTPRVGNNFKTFKTKEEAVEYSINLEVDKYIEEDIKDFSKTTLPIVLKADTLGSLDAITYELNKLGNEKIKAKVVQKGIGQITEKDIKAAQLNKCLVLGFNVEADKSANVLSLRDNIEIKIFKIIYELINLVKERLHEASPVETVESITGHAKILKIFSQTKDKQIVGGRVEDGEIRSGSTVRIIRRENHIADGKIREMQSQKIKTSSVGEGTEFGMMIECKTEIVPGDYISAISMVEQK